MTFVAQLIGYIVIYGFATILAIAAVCRVACAIREWRYERKQAARERMTTPVVPASFAFPMVPLFFYMASGDEIDLRLQLYIENGRRQWASMGVIATKAVQVIYDGKVLHTGQVWHDSGYFEAHEDNSPIVFKIRNPQRCLIAVAAETHVGSDGPKPHLLISEHDKDWVQKRVKKGKS